MPKLTREQVQDEFARMKRRIKNLEAENESLRIQIDEQQSKASRRKSDVQTTEATGKFWKLLLLLGSAGSIVGLFVFSYGVNQEQTGLTAVGAVVGVASFLTYAAGRFGKFWFHD